MCYYKQSPVCASNGRTYCNQCMMDDEACVDEVPLRVVNKGECTKNPGIVCRHGSREQYLGHWHSKWSRWERSVASERGSWRRGRGVDWGIREGYPLLSRLGVWGAPCTSPTRADTHYGVFFWSHRTFFFAHICWWFEFVKVFRVTFGAVAHLHQRRTVPECVQKVSINMCLSREWLSL